MAEMGKGDEAGEVRAGRRGPSHLPDTAMGMGTVVGTVCYSLSAALQTGYWLQSGSFCSTGAAPAWLARSTRDGEHAVWWSVVVQHEVAGSDKSSCPVPFSIWIRGGCGKKISRRDNLAVMCSADALMDPFCISFLFV
jgi:hypothetical protein